MILYTFTSIYDINIWLIGFSWRQKRLFMITLKMIWHLHSEDEVDLLQTNCKRFIHCIFIICWTLSPVTSWSHPSVWRIVTFHIWDAFGLSSYLSTSSLCISRVKHSNNLDPLCHCINSFHHDENKMINEMFTDVPQTQVLSINMIWHKLSHYQTYVSIADHVFVLRASSLKM